MQQTRYTSSFQKQWYHAHPFSVSKDKDTTTQKSGVTYQFKCTQVYCKEEYSGESGRTFGDRLKEHLRAFSCLPALPVHTTPHQWELLIHCRQGSPQHQQDHEGGHGHLCQWPIPQLEPEEIPDAPHIGWGPVGHPLHPPQVICYCHQCSPQWASPPHMGDAHKFHHFGKYGPPLDVLIHPYSHPLVPVYIRHELVPFMVSTDFW